MQTLWSRAAQAKSSCRCSSCLHATTALARRSTTAASRRRVKFGDVFTACYSTVLATAVFADARVKEDRMKEWDRVIAAAKAGKAVEETSVPETTTGQLRSENLGEKGYLLKNIRYHHSPDPKLRKLGDWNATSWSPPIDTITKLQLLEEQLENATGSTEDLSVDYSSTHNTSAFESKEFLNDHLEALPSQSYRPCEPKTQNHLWRIENMIRALVDQLLQRTNLQPSQVSLRDPANHTHECAKRALAEQIGQLRTSFITLPNYEMEDPEAINKQRMTLHVSLARLCRGLNESSDDDLISARICYNLLVSPTPPNIATYNLLIRAFLRMKRYDLSELVVESFLGSKLVPNESTIKLILDHYIVKKDAFKFKLFISRMRGEDGGLNFKKKHTDYLWAPHLQEWATTSNVHVQGDYLVEKVDRTAGIFERLIRGSFEMAGLVDAVRFVRIALHEGQKISSEVFYRIVEACVARRDFVAGHRLLKAVLSIWTDGANNSLIDFTSDARSSMCKLLALCGVEPDLTSSNATFTSQTSLGRLLRHLRFRIIEEDVARHAHRLLSLTLAFRTELVDQSGSPNVSKDGIGEALVILHKARRSQLWEAARVESHKKTHRWLRLQYFEYQLMIHSGLNLAISQEIKELQTEWTSPRVSLKELQPKQNFPRISWKEQQLKRNSPRASLPALGAIEAEWAIQRAWIDRQESELLGHDRLSDEGWDKFISTVQKRHLKGWKNSNPLRLVRLLKEEEKLAEQKSLANTVNDSESKEDGQPRETISNSSMPVQCLEVAAPEYSRDEVPRRTSHLPLPAPQLLPSGDPILDLPRRFSGNVVYT